jgi:DNA invertase Pin-like site-specific DNA recombinase
MQPPSRLSELQGVNAVGFVRVSTDHQNLSPDTQRRTIERFAQAHGIMIARFVELTISGRDAWRDPAVTEITTQAEQGHVRAVLVAALDRMGRSSRTDLFIDDLTAAGAVLVDASSELVSGNATHRRTMRTGVAAARNESDITAERVMNAINDRNLNNADQWGRPPLGFVREGADPDKRRISHLLIDPATIGEAVALFERYAEGNISINQLARATGRNPNGLKDLLANRLYNGWVQNRGQWSPAPWRESPPISDTLFATVQATRTLRSRGGGRHRPERPNAWRGILHCASCDARLTLAGFGANGQRIEHVNPCEGWGDQAHRNLNRWTNALDAQIASINVGADVAKEVVAALNVGKVAPTPTRFRPERDQLDRALIARRITGIEYETQRNALDAEEAEQRVESPSITTEAEVLAALEDIRATWLMADEHARARLIRAVYQQVRVNADGTFANQDAIHLTPEATAMGLPLALPETVTASLACPRGLEPPTFRSAT